MSIVKHNCNLFKNCGQFHSRMVGWGDAVPSAPQPCFTNLRREAHMCARLALVVGGTVPSFCKGVVSTKTSLAATTL